VPSGWIVERLDVFVTVRELAEMSMSAIGYSGASKSDGTPRMLDITRLNGLGSRVSLSAVSNTHTVGSRRTTYARV
jgi:hypothetical protein